jgi:tetratricopeptide (TPR) repeat protein
MNQGEYRMKRASGFILAFAMALLTACASAGGGAGADVGDAGDQSYENRPRDDANTRSGGVHLAQAALGGEAAAEHYTLALTDARAAIQADPMNPKAHLIGGQAALGAGLWLVADSMFDRAEELYPPYREQLVSEREQGWVDAYNQGSEALAAGDLDAALEYFSGADALYDDRPEARLALGAVYTRMGETERAAEAYRGALDILAGPPPEGIADDQLEKWHRDRQVATFNAAQLMAQAGRFDDAAEILGTFLEGNAGTLDAATELQALTAQAGFLAQAGRADEAEALYEEVLGRTDLSSSEYFQVGIGFFNTGDYVRAAEAFETAAELNPYSRDALLNLVQSLYSAALELEQTEESAARNQTLDGYYDRILEAAEQVREFDPANRNVLSFMLRAYRAKADLASAAEAQRLTQRTQELFRVYQQQPYEVSDIALTMQADTQAEITGVLENLTARGGEQVTLRFEVLAADGVVIDASTVTVTAPAQGETTEFSTMVDTGTQDFAGWRYELVR